MILTTFHGHTRHCGLFLDEKIKRKLENVKHFCCCCCRPNGFTNMCDRAKMCHIIRNGNSWSNIEQNSSQHCATVFIYLYFIKSQSRVFHLVLINRVFIFHLIFVQYLIYFILFHSQTSIPYAIYLLIHFNNFSAAP